MKKLFRNRKAVSPVIATVLLILVTMAGMSVLFGAIIVYSDNFQKGSGSSILESLTVEDVYFQSNEVRLTLYNTGKTTATITNVYINNAIYELDLTSSQAADDPHRLSLNVGAHGEIYIDGSFSKGSYLFKIVTLRGTGFEGTYVYG